MQQILRKEVNEQNKFLFVLKRQIHMSRFDQIKNHCEKKRKNK